MLTTIPQQRLMCNLPTIYSTSYIKLNVRDSITAKSLLTSISWFTSADPIQWSLAGWLIDSWCDLRSCWLLLVACVVIGSNDAVYWQFLVGVRSIWWCFNWWPTKLSNLVNCFWQVGYWCGLTWSFPVVPPTWSLWTGVPLFCGLSSWLTSGFSGSWWLDVKRRFFGGATAM